jgi:hypothetical protein
MHLEKKTRCWLECERKRGSQRETGEGTPTPEELGGSIELTLVPLIPLNISQASPVL